MLKKIEELGKSQVETLTATSAVLTKGLQKIAEETASYSKKQFETSSATFQELLKVKSFDKVIEIQTGFAKQAYEGFVAQSTKVGDLYSELLKEVAKPIQSTFAKNETVAIASQPVATKAKAA